MIILSSSSSSSSFFFFPFFIFGLIIKKTKVPKKRYIINFYEQANSRRIVYQIVKNKTNQDP